MTTLCLRGESVLLMPFCSVILSCTALSSWPLSSFWPSGEGYVIRKEPKVFRSRPRTRLFFELPLVYVYFFLLDDLWQAKLCSLPLCRHFQRVFCFTVAWRTLNSSEIRTAELVSHGLFSFYFMFWATYGPPCVPLAGGPFLDAPGLF